MHGRGAVEVTPGDRSVEAVRHRIPHDVSVDRVSAITRQRGPGGLQPWIRNNPLPRHLRNETPPAFPPDALPEPAWEAARQASERPVLVNDDPGHKARERAALVEGAGRLLCVHEDSGIGNDDAHRHRSVM